MKTFTAIATAATIALLTVAPAHAQMSGLAATAPKIEAGQEIVHKTRSRRHRGKIGAGIALGIIGAAAIAAASHRGYAEERYESRFERRCRRWMYRCEDGDYRSCRKFDYRC